eukprot:2161190-Pleurochrysis_carterae.AAC.1
MGKGRPEIVGNGGIRKDSTELRERVWRGSDARKEIGGVGVARAHSDSTGICEAVKQGTG